MRYQVNEDVTGVSVGEHEIVADENGIIEVTDPEHVLALAQFERDGILVRLPDEPVKAKVKRGRNKDTEKPE